MATLSRIDASREPLEAIAARDLASERDSYGWRSRCALMMAEWWNRKEVSYHQLALLNSSQRGRGVDLRLLLADLAVRLYQREQQRLPQQLSDLVPRYLTAVPIDPYSGNPLIYRPDGESFLLYSVGQDGRDDGGRIRPADESSLTPGYDLRLAPDEE